MSEKQEPLIITICMGSSCFSRGNNNNLQVIQSYLKKYNLEAQVKLVGSRCEAECMRGPNIRVNGELYQNVDPGSVIDILNHHLKKDQ